MTSGRRHPQELDSGVLALVHELRQPIMAIKLRMQLAIEAGHGADRGALMEMLDQLVHLEEILGQHAVSLNGAPSQVDFAAEVQRALVMLAPRVDTSSAFLDVRVPPGPIAVRHRPVAIRQVVVNLVRNALDAVSGADAKVVRVEVLVDTNGVQLVVEDTGPGVAPEVARRLFEPFVTTKQPGEGTGLGLFIARRLLDELGGTLAVGQGAQGARFVAVFPRA